MMKLNVIFMIVDVTNYPSSLCLNFQAFHKKGMRFERFTQLTIMQKQEKLIRAFQKISTRAERDRNIYKSVNNFFCILEIYSDMLQVMCDLHNFLTNLLNDEDIESKPACHNKDPSIFGIEFLAIDFDILLDVIMESLKNNEIKDHDKCDELFKKAHKLYEKVKFFEKKYHKIRMRKTRNKFIKLDKLTTFYSLRTHL